VVIGVGVGVGGQLGGVREEIFREREALIEDYGGAEEFLAEELEALDVRKVDGEVESGVRVVREAAETRFFVL